MVKDLNFKKGLFIGLILLILIFSVDFSTFFPFMYIKEWFLKAGSIFCVSFSIIWAVIQKKRLKFYINTADVLLLLFIIFFSIQGFLFFGNLKLAYTQLLNLISILFLSIVFKRDIIRFLRYYFENFIELSALIISAIAIAQMNRYFINHTGRIAITTTLGSINFTAFFLGISLIISILRIILKKGSYFSIINILISIPVFIFCGSRIALFSLIMVLILLIFSVGSKKNFLRVIIVLLLFLGFAIVISYFNSNIAKRYSKDIMKFFSGNEERIFLWKISGKIIKDHPFGVSLGGFKYFFPEYQGKYLSSIKKGLYFKYRKNYFAVEAHNEYIQIFSEGGILLFGIFIAFIILLFRNMYRKQRNKLTVNMIVLFTLLIALTSLPFHVVPLSFIIFLMISSLFPYMKIEFRISKRLSLFIAIFIAVLMFLSTRYLIRDLIGNRRQFFGSIVSDDIIAVKFLKSAEKYIDYSPRLYFELGNRYSRLKRYELALNEYSKALSLSNMPAIFSNAGYILAITGNYHEAENFILKALRIDPKNQAYRYKLGLCYYLENKYNEAISQLSEVLIMAEDTDLRDKAACILEDIRKNH